MALIDKIAQMFGTQPGAALGLPELQNGFQDYGPWGAGGGQPGAGAFPESPAKTGVLQATQSPSAPMQPQFPDAPQRQSPMAPAEQPYSYAMDPSRGGLLSFIGGLNGSPTRAEYNARRVGHYTASTIQALTERVKQGMTPQKAVMDYANTPEGMAAISNPGSNFLEDAKTFLSEVIAKPENLQTVAPGSALVSDAGRVAYQAPAAPKPDYDINGVRYNGDTNQPVAGTPNATGTPEMQNYDAYVKQETAAGRKPMSMQDWHNDQASHGVDKGATADNGRVISVPMQNYQIDLIKKADGMAAQQQALHDVAVLSKGADSGWIQAATLPLRNLLNSIGVTSDETVPIQQIFQSQTNALALAARGQNVLSGTVGLTGNTSDKDLAFLINTVPNLWNSAKANAGIIVLAEAQARRQEQVARMQAEYIDKNGNLNGFGKELDKFFRDDKSPDHIDFLTPDEKKTLQDLNTSAGDIATSSKMSGALGSADRTPLMSEPPAGFTEGKEFWNQQTPEWRKAFNEAGPKQPRGEDQGPPYEPGLAVNDATKRPQSHGHAHGENPAPKLGNVGHSHGRAPQPAPQVSGGPLARGGPRGPQGPSGVQIMQPGNSSMPADQFAQPASPDQFITLQDILRMFGGGGQASALPRGPLFGGFDPNRMGSQ